VQFADYSSHTVCATNTLNTVGNLPSQVARPSDLWGAAAAGLILAGIALRSWAAGTLRKGRALTTWGPYRLCRHPLYLGSLLVMAGFCLLIPDGKNLVVVLGPVGLIYWLTMRREERRLAHKYGAAWASYAAKTPRLVPRRLPRRLGGSWSLAQWTRSAEYRALSVTLLTLLAIELWRAFN